MIKAFIFDIGGTLVKTDDALIYAFQLALKNNGIELKNREKVIHDLGKSNYINIKNAVDHSYSGDDIDKKIENCYNSFKSIFPKDVISHFKLFPGVKSSLQLLKDEGMKLGVFTGFNKDETSFFMEKMGLKKFFDVIVTVDDVKKPRPDPEGLLLEIKKLGVKNEECIYVGDAVADIRMAKNANVKIVCVKTGIQDNKVLEAEKPDYFVENVKEAVKILKPCQRLVR
jgi:pyrophosphatase PpaX